MSRTRPRFDGNDLFTLVGELGLDGALRVPRGFSSLRAALDASGTTTAIVPDEVANDPATKGLFRSIGAGSLNEALAILTGTWHYPQGCNHCGDAHQTCSPPPSARLAPSRPSPARHLPSITRTR
ncbi:hypothetical protein [Streptomyces sp. NPDC005148]